MATKYWVGGTGFWNDAANHWALSSGGAPGSSNLPTSSDDVVFDSASSSVLYTTTVNVTANCLNLTVGAPATGKITLAGSSALNVSGNINMSGGLAGITLTYTGFLTMVATSGTKTLTSNGMTLPSVKFNGSGGTFQLADAFKVNANLTLTAGTFDANGQTTTLAASSTTNVVGSFTFYNLIMTSGADAFLVAFANNFTVTNLLTFGGGSGRLFVRSSSRGTQRTITAASVTASSVDLQDMVGAGAANWDLSSATGGSGDCSGNSNITFTIAQTNYWKHGASASYNWDTLANWYLATNGAGGAGRVPLAQDTAIFDSNSFGSSGKTVVQNKARVGAMTWTGVTNTPTFTTSTAASFYGSLTLSSGMTLTASVSSYTFEGGSSANLDSAGQTWGKDFNFNASGATLTLSSDFITTGIITYSKGTLDANNHVISAKSFSGATGTLTLGSATHMITGTTGLLWNGSGTINVGTSTVKFTGTLTADITFNGNSQTYYNLWNATSGAFNFIVSGSNTFNDFKTNAGRTIKFTTGTTQTVTTFTGSGTAGNLTVIDSTTTGTHALVKAGGGTIICDYMNIQHSVATPSSTWYGGFNSTNNQAVTTAGSGWTFSGGAGSSSYTIALAYSTFSFSGIDSIFYRIQTFVADMASFILIGEDMGFHRLINIVLDLGNFVLTGTVTSLRGIGDWIWTRLGIPTSSWSDNSKPSSTWSNTSEPSSSWNNESK